MPTWHQRRPRLLLKHRPRCLLTNHSLNCQFKMESLRLVRTPVPRPLKFLSSSSSPPLRRLPTRLCKLFSSPLRQWLSRTPSLPHNSKRATKQRLAKPLRWSRRRPHRPHSRAAIQPLLPLRRLKPLPKSLLLSPPQSLSKRQWWRRPLSSNPLKPLGPLPHLHLPSSLQWLLPLPPSKGHYRP